MLETGSMSKTARRCASNSSQGLPLTPRTDRNLCVFCWGYLLGFRGFSKASSYPRVPLSFQVMSDLQLVAPVFCDREKSGLRLRYFQFGED